MSLTAGFDVGGTRIKYGLVDAAGLAIFQGNEATPPDMAGLLAAFKEIWEKMRLAAGRKKIIGAGFGFPGIFSMKKERIIQSPNYPDLDGFPLRPFLQKCFSLPFWIDNDANLAAYGEWWLGTKKKPKSLVLLTIGTGVGSGIILEGRIWHGTAGFAAECGHIIVNPEGEKCNCGNRGCLETEVSAPKIVRNYQEISGKKEPITAEEVARRAKKGEVAAKESFNRAGYFLGLGLGIIISILNPEMIVLGGGVMASGRLLLEPALREAKKRCFPAAFASTIIRPAALGNDAGFLGAALFARTQKGKSLISPKNPFF